MSTSETCAARRLEPVLTPCPWLRGPRSPSERESSASPATYSSGKSPGSEPVPRETPCSSDVSLPHHGSAPLPWRCTRAGAAGSGRCGATPGLRGYCRVRRRSVRWWLMRSGRAIAADCGTSTSAPSGHISPIWVGRSTAAGVNVVAHIGSRRIVLRFGGHEDSDGARARGTHPFNERATSGIGT
jgi:hypothetical protein